MAGPELRQRWRALRRRVPETAADVALGVVFLAAMLTERAFTVDTWLPVAMGLSVVVVAGLLARRRAPLLGYLVGSAALAAEALLISPSPISPYANLIGIYSLGLYARRPRVWWGPVLAPPGIAAYFVGVGTTSLSTILGAVFSWLLAWALGYSTARWRSEQQLAQQLLRHQVLGDERTRLARELHDLVGHTVNLMVVQAGAARRLLDTDRAKARDLLSSAEETGRSALVDLDHTLGILRSDAVAAEPSGLPGLVRQMGEAGIEVVLEVDDSVAAGAASLALSAYRIVQEALTNALKHGQARTATVRVRKEAGDLIVEVRDDGRGAPPGYQPGRGLLGIDERVALFGGSVQHGTVDGQGFRLRAVLPLP